MAMKAVRCTNGQSQPQAVRRRFAHRQRGGVAQRRCGARVVLGFERGNALRDLRTRTLVEPPDQDENACNRDALVPDIPAQGYQISADDSVNAGSAAGAISKGASSMRSDAKLPSVESGERNT